LLPQTFEETPTSLLHSNELYLDELDGWDSKEIHDILFVDDGITQSHHEKNATMYNTN
jgi:hypothetical protein